MEELENLLLHEIEDENAEKLQKLIEENKDKIDDEFVKKFKESSVSYLDTIQYSWEYYTGRNIEIFDVLINNNLIGKDEINKRLLFALKERQESGAKYFLSKGADPNYNENGKTPLLCAIENAKTEYHANYDNDVVKMLCQHGADPNLQNPILSAIKKGRTDIVETLIQKGADHPKQLEEVLKGWSSEVYKKSRKLPREFRKAFRMGRKEYGYESVAKKIKEKISYIDGSDVAIFTLCSVLGAAGVTLLGLVGHVINWAVIDSNLNNANNDISNKRLELGQTVANKANLSNFDIASMELAQGENDYILKAFGSTSVEQVAGLKENNYLNVFFNISEIQARNILNAVNSAEQTERAGSYNSPEHDIGIGDLNIWNYSESGRINTTKEAMVEVYNQLNNAVNNAYACEIENIAEASTMNNSISREYRYTRPEVVGDADMYGLFSHGSTTFINSGAVTTSISQVVKDETRGVSYFLVDTLQGRAVDGNIILESCRARIEVEGTDLTQEEVYAKFIRGEHSSFTEIVREKVGSKTGVVNNQLKDNVDEIELL